MVRLFQLQLEHYEKVEGHVPQPGGQGQPAVDDDSRQPAVGDDGPRRRADLRRLRRAPWPRPAVGLRRHGWPLRGARLRRQRVREPARARSSSSAGAPTSTATVRSAAPAGPVENVNADSATGGPDVLRGIYPVVATITAAGWTRIDDGDPRDTLRAARGLPAGRGAADMSMPFYVAPEQVMKDRADYARKGIATGRALVALRYLDGARHRRREQLADAAQGQRDLRPRRVRRGRSLQRVRPAPRRRRPSGGSEGVPVPAATTSTARSLANQYAQILGQIFTRKR